MRDVKRGLKRSATPQSPEVRCAFATKSRKFGLTVFISASFLATVGCTTGGSSSIAQAPIHFTADGAPAPIASPLAVENGDYANGVSTYYALAGSAVLPVTKAPTLEDEAATLGVKSPLPPTGALSAATGDMATSVTSAIASTPAAAASSVASTVGDASSTLQSPATSLVQGALPTSPASSPLVQPGAAAAASSAVAVAQAVSPSIASAALPTHGSLLNGPASGSAPPATAIASALLTAASVQQQTMKACLLKPKC